MSNTFERKFMYQQTKLNILYCENLNVGENAYFLYLPENVCVESVTDFDLIRQQPNIQRAYIYFILFLIIM